MYVSQVLIAAAPPAAAHVLGLTLEWQVDESGQKPVDQTHPDSSHVCTMSPCLCHICGAGALDDQSPGVPACVVAGKPCQPPSAPAVSAPAQLQSRPFALAKAAAVGGAYGGGKGGGPGGGGGAGAGGVGGGGGGKFIQS